MVVAAPSSSCSSISISSELGSLFAAFDADADGRISASELRECMRATLGAEAAVSAEEAEALVADADADGDGLLDAAEFAGLVARLQQDAGEEDRHRGLRQAFGMYSETENNMEGCITPASLRRMLARLGEHQDVDECRAMICRFDLDGDGVLSFDEFKIMMNAA
jgi:calcium-binding protein CML